MASDPAPADEADLLARMQDLQERLRISEETLDAIRRGEVDALVVGAYSHEHKVYTLEGADRPYRLLIEQIGEGAVTLSAEGTVLYGNRRLAHLLGTPTERVIGHPFRIFVKPADVTAFDLLLQEAGTAGSRGEVQLLAADGTEVPVQLSLSPMEDEGGSVLLCGVVTDLTDQVLHVREVETVNARLVAEIADRERIEEALRQSQKMEAVGQLTGGLAHDFNNLLAGISGSLEMLQTRILQGRVSEVDRYVNAAQGATKRAATLTHRLLAFSRRQTLDPKPTDLNRLVSGMEELVRRTIGLNIEMESVLAGGLWATLVDQGQLENALLNLCINARDAMPDGGRLTIETSNRWLDHHGARERDLAPGQYVSLCVSDDGTGMSPGVAAKAFEPFFTTKPLGLGTGLGLSMVYGFARQSGGQVRIYSELGQGTMICLYLPRHVGETEEVSLPPSIGVLARGRQGETVLVVDDEPTIRMLVTDVLENLGYTAIEAADGPAGLRVLQSNVRIDLLITDVGLPGGMNGRQVADAARTVRPDLKVLFITGYAENAVLSHGHLAAGMQVLTKPFAMEILATRIKELITQE